MQTSYDRAADTLISVTGLTKKYGRSTALENVSLTIQRNEILGLIGPNGAGKTTLLECISGLLPADSGRVTLHPDTSERGSQFFYLPDGISPWPEQTVGWALRFCIQFFGGRELEYEEIVCDLRLGSLLQSPIKSLSKGQRKRVMLAVGLLAPQAILMIDEPFEGLDLRQSRELQTILRKHVARGRTVLVSIHQIADAALICDRFVLLDNGKIAADGTLDELRELAHHSNPEASDLEEIFLALT